MKGITIMKKLVSILLVCVLMFGAMSLTSVSGNETTGTPDPVAKSQEEATVENVTNEAPVIADNEAPAAVEDEALAPVVNDTTPVTLENNSSKEGISMSDLSDLMQPFFSSKTIKDESVMFLDKGDVKTLLYPIDKIISVTSSDEKTVYKEGVDYEVVNGRLKVLENSSIPCITRATYYNYSGSRLTTIYNGQAVPTFWGESQMAQWQVSVTYTHSSEWNGFKQPCQSDVFENFIKKLQNGEDVTVFFSGDSITAGANSSFNGNYAPYVRTYPMLFCEALADLYGYTVKYIYVKDNLTNTAPRIPSEDYVAGTNGTITYINTAVGGWRSAHGVSNIQSYILDYINKYGCDLLVLAYGMNDRHTHNNAPTRNNLKIITDSVLKIAPDANVALVATMVHNPNSNDNNAFEKMQMGDDIMNLAEYYRASGVPCGVCDMGSVCLSLLVRKEFQDFSGNNINHPNDFFHRVYAQTLLQTVIGYENMN